MADKPKDLFLYEGISHFCFNKDFTQCAVSKKDNRVYIYQVPDIKDTNKWVLLHTLKAHFLYISGLDWSAATNRIVTCSFDKTCFIWAFIQDKWVGTSLTATTKLSYLFVYWNNRGDKFITGTSDKKLFMGYYSQQADWWTGRNIKGHKSSVVCARIDPSSLYCLSGSTDMKVMVTSVYEPTIDDQFLAPGAQPQPFGTEIMNVDCGSWINSVCWNTTGSFGVAAAQDANIYIIDYINNSAQSIPLAHGAVSMVVPCGENSFYAVGFDREIYLYANEGGAWTMKKKITGTNEKAAGASSSMGGLKGGIAERMKKFEKAGVNTKTSIIYTAQTTNKNLHQSPLTSFVVNGNKIITSDIAGFVKYWDV